MDLIDDIVIPIMKFMWRALGSRPKGEKPITLPETLRIQPMETNYKRGKTFINTFFLKKKNQTEVKKL